MIPFDISDLILQISNSTAPIVSNSGVVDQLSDSTTAATILGGTGIVGAAAAAIKSVFTSKNQKKNEKDTDLDQEQYVDLLDTIWNYAVVHPDKTLGQILELPAYPDQKMITTKLKEALAKERKEWKEYNIKKYYLKK